MGSYDRDYMQDDFSQRSMFGGGGGSGWRSWSVVTWLIIINVTIFLVQSLANVDPGTFPWLALSLDSLKSGYVWTVFTHCFFHGSLLHIVFNSVALFFIGRIFRQQVSTKIFLTVFLLGGAVGGLLQVLVFQNTNLIGASASTMAIFLALAGMIPNFRFRLLLFFVIPIETTFKRLAQIVVGLDVLLLIFSISGFDAAPQETGQARTAYLAHLGGAAFGLVYALKFLKGDMGYETKEKSTNRKFRFGRKKVVDAEVMTTPGSPTPGRRPSFRGEKPSYVSPDVDAILDKISAEGMHSLTPEERQILEDSSEQIARRTGR